MGKQKLTETVHYILTFISIAALVGCFATHFITGDAAIIPMDSLGGSLLLGIVFLCYLVWFVYDSASSKNISLSASARINLRSSAVAFCVYAFWIVFIIVPVSLNLLNG